MNSIEDQLQAFEKTRKVLQEQIFHLMKMFEKIEPSVTVLNDTLYRANIMSENLTEASSKVNVRDLKDNILCALGDISNKLLSTPEHVYALERKYDKMMNKFQETIDVFKSEIWRINEFINKLPPLQLEIGYHWKDIEKEKKEEESRILDKKTIKTILNMRAERATYWEISHILKIPTDRIRQIINSEIRKRKSIKKSK